MPTSAELIDCQYDFELPRGLLTINRGERVVDRLLDEVDELRTEIQQKNYFEAIYEAIDVVIFAHSIMGWLARETGIAYEEVDQMVAKKFARNHQKYDIEIFKQYEPETAIKVSRDTWEMRRNGHY